MRRERLFLLLSLAANVLLFAGLFYVLNELARTRVVGAKERQQSDRLWKRVSELESAAKPAAANKSPLTDAEVLELARLRSEVTRLRDEQRSAIKKSSIQSPQPEGAALVESSTTAPGSFRGVATLITSVLATVDLGQSLVVGGWESPVSGKRIVALVTPELHRASTEPPVDGIALTTHIVEMSNSTFETLGLGAMWRGQAGGNAQATLTQEQMKGLLERAKELTGTDTLSAPRVVTWSGREAQVSVSNIGADGIEFGPSLNVTPTLDAARASVRLDLKFQLNLPPPSPLAP